MRIRSYLSYRSRSLALTFLAAVGLVVWGISFSSVSAKSKTAKKVRPAGSLTINAWTFDRGNAGVSENPGKFGDYRDKHPELILTGDGKQPWFVEYDIDFPVSTTFTMQMRYASAGKRPIKVWLDDKLIGECCGSVTNNAPPYPDRHMSYTKDLPQRTWNMHGAQWEEGVKIPATAGVHTLKFTRDGAAPNPITFKLESPVKFPKGWKSSTPRKLVLDRIPFRYRRVFLKADAVNILALRMAIEDKIKTLGPKYPNGPSHLKQLAKLEEKQTAVKDAAPEQQQGVEEALSTLRKQALLDHPALDFNALLFVKNKYQPSSTYRKHNVNTHGGGNLCVLSPVSPDGKVTELVPELSGGLFQRFDLSFDATRVLFSYAKPGGRLRIYEINIDPKTGQRVSGSKLRQVTFGGKDEAEAIARGVGGVARDGFHDLDPCYMPDGNIMFASTRSQRSVLCFPQSVTTLHSMRSDGSDIRCLSAGQVSELNPTVLDDGRIAYMRWEYVDKGFGNAQSLWALRPDGSGSDHIFKNNLVRPATMVQPRSVPDSRLLVTIGAGHHGGLHGPVILVDNRRNRRTAEGMTTLTPEITYPGMFGMQGNGGQFKEPYPFSEKFFLISHKPGGRKFTKEERGAEYALYALDWWGNRAELYRDPNFSCNQPMPVRPRRKPISITPVRAHAVAKDAHLDQKTKEEGLATMFMLDVYQGLEGIKRGRVKFVRVMEAKNLPWYDEGRASKQGDGTGNWQASAVSYKGDVARKKSWGVATVHEDGSAQFTVPADKNVFFQALDENYMELHRMRSFINFQAGEKRSCIGCHEGRRQAPSLSNEMPMALAQPVQALQPQPGDKKAARPIHFAADIQPIFDRKCVSCHGGENPKGELDLTEKLTKLFSRSYETLAKKGLISYLHTDGFGSAMVGLERPLTYGSHKSILVDRIRMAPCKSTVTREEFIRIVTWIDANAPYYGTHRGKKNIKWKDDPEFRPLPDHTD